MPDSIRFHLDEHIDHAVARALRATCIDVTTTVEANLLAKDDLSQMDYATLGHRTLVTDDVDFLAMANIRVDHPGIVFCHRNQRTLGEIIRTLVWLHSNFDAQDVRDRVIHVPKRLPDKRDL